MLKQQGPQNWQPYLFYHVYSISGNHCTITHFYDWHVRSNWVTWPCPAKNLLWNVYTRCWSTQAMLDKNTKYIKYRYSVFRGCYANCLHKGPGSHKHSNLILKTASCVCISWLCNNTHYLLFDPCLPISTKRYCWTPNQVHALPTSLSKKLLFDKLRNIR